MVEQFLQYLSSEKRYSDHTILAYRKDIVDFFEFSTIEKQSDLRSLSYQDIRGWIVYLMESGIVSRSVNRKISSLRSFFKYAMRQKWVSHNPVKMIAGPKVEKRLPVFVQEKDMKKLSNPDRDLFSDDHTGKRDQLIMELFYQTGIRLSELIGLKDGSVSGDRVKVLGKRNKERIVPIMPELAQMINEYIEVRNEEFGTQKDDSLLLTDSGKKLYPKFVYGKVNCYIGLVSDLSKRGPHVLRHTFATHMLNRGAELESIKEILGHADLNATQVYTHNSFKQLNEVYNNAHPRAKKRR